MTTLTSGIRTSKDLTEALHTGDQPRECSAFLYDLYQHGETVEGLDYDPGFLYVIVQGSADTEDELVREIHRGHDMAVLYTFASRRFQTFAKEMRADLLGHRVLSPFSLTNGIQHALAERTLALRLGGLLLHRCSKDFQS